MHIDTHTARGLRQRLLGLREAARRHRSQMPLADARFSEHRGICTQLGEAGDPRRRAFSALATAWPKHSGDSEYPVPAPDGVESPAYVYHTQGDMWVGKYGDLRMELLDFVINQLEGY